jgi:soluble lytic murein transglycosylase-like protein
MTVEQMIRDEALRQGVPPDLAVAVARRESGLNPNVRDGAFGEVGLFQVKPSTAADLGVSNLHD